jgi:uncharacterized protein (DUF983 family)
VYQSTAAGGKSSPIEHARSLGPPAEKTYDEGLAPLASRCIVKNRFVVLVSRAIRLRCPLCGQGRLFRNWFIMQERCSHCGVKFEREPGFYLGSIYINYGLTALVATIVYPVLRIGWGFPKNPLLLGTMVFVVLFPITWFPWARSLWIGFDQWRDPQEGEV